MKTRTYPIFLTTLFATVLMLASALVTGAPPEKVKPVDLQNFMVQKRAYSQIVLDGLMSEDYQTIILAGENMRKMRADKRWDRFTSADYKRYSEDFENAAQSMVDAARRRNLDGSMNAYMTCLRACYNCHKYVRAFPVPTSFEGKP
jgi:cytochrome c556